MTGSKNNIIATMMTVALLSGSCFSHATSTVDALERHSVTTKLGDNSVLLDVTSVRDKVYAVGERGLILESNDGVHWSQQKSPVSVTLTGITFSDELHGYAIGHGGAVLRTVDGGQRWNKIWDGRVMAAQLLETAEIEGDEDTIRSKQLLVDDGPDKPFLDLLQLSDKHLVIVGAYGLAFETTDGGETWQPWMDRLDNFFGAHLYVIRKQGNNLLIAGEMGFVALSHDAGNTFRVLETPYEGSYFTAEFLKDGRILLAGLRGNTFISDAHGEDWEQVFNPIHASIVASTVIKDDRIFMVNQAGLILTLKNNALVTTTHHAFPPLTDIAQIPSGDLLILSIHGAIPTSIGGLQ